MKTDRNAFIAGLFMFCSIIAACGVLIGIKGMPGVVVAMQTRQVRFSLHDDVAGLRAGDDVRLGGLRVGSIRAIDVDTGAPEPGIMVTFTMPARYVLHASATIAVQSTLTGTVCLNIEHLGDPTTPPIADGQALTGSPSSISSVLAALEKAAPDIAAIAHDVRTQTVPKVDAAVDSFHQTGQTAAQFVQHVDSKIDPIVTRYNTVADKTASTMTQASSLLGDTKPDIRGTIAHLNVITRELQARLPGLLGEVNDTLASARSAIQDAKQTLVNTRDISATARSLVTDNQSKFAAIINDLDATGENLKAGSVEIRHSPWRLLYKPAPDEMGNVNLYDSARQFADGAESLNGAASALRDALRDPQTDPAQIKKLMDELNAAFDHFNQVEQKLWSAVKE